VASSKLVSNLNSNYLQGWTQDTNSTASTIVRRDASKNIFANDVNADGSFKGALQYSIGVSGALTITNNTAFNNSESKTINLNASSANTANFVVQRDASGNFSAGTITATLTGNISGNAATANKATNVVGTSGRILYNNNTDTTTTSSNLAFDGTNLSVGGDITAFASDIRLKTNIKKIENALDKVSKLSGFTYNFNDLAFDLGFISKERIAGVSAQEVQSVLPEAVKPAPANPEYLTVQYEKLVPLLIEAIKDLKGEVSELRAELDQLKGTK
jgi:hypothetical protein